MIFPDFLEDLWFTMQSECVSKHWWKKKVNFNEKIVVELEGYKKRKKMMFASKKLKLHLKWMKNTHIDKLGNFCRFITIQGKIKVKLKNINYTCLFFCDICFPFSDLKWNECIKAENFWLEKSI